MGTQTIVPSADYASSFTSAGIIDTPAGDDSQMASGTVTEQVPALETLPPVPQVLAQLGYRAVLRNRKLIEGS